MSFCGVVWSPGLSIDLSNVPLNTRTWLTRKPSSVHPLLQHHSTSTPIATPQSLFQDSDTRVERKVLVQPQHQVEQAQAVCSSLPLLEPQVLDSPTQETGAVITSQRDTTHLAQPPSQTVNLKSISVINLPSPSQTSVHNHKVTAARGVWVLRHLTVHLLQAKSIA